MGFLKRKLCDTPKYSVYLRFEYLPKWLFSVKYIYRECHILVCSRVIVVMDKGGSPVGGV